MAGARLRLTALEPLRVQLARRVALSIRRVFVKVTADARAEIARARSEASLRITLTWKRAD